jgi:threonine/homoserine/homoserine lactone efflux protein
VTLPLSIVGPGKSALSVRSRMGAAETTAPSSPWFSWIVIVVILLMFVCLAIWVVLGVLLADPTSSQAALIEGMSRAFFGCLGALLGLVGGKFA